MILKWKAFKNRISYQNPLGQHGTPNIGVCLLLCNIATVRVLISTLCRDLSMPKITLKRQCYMTLNPEIMKFRRCPQSSKVQADTRRINWLDKKTQFGNLGLGPFNGHIRVTNSPENNPRVPGFFSPWCHLTWTLDRLPCHVTRTGCFTRLSVPCSRWTVSLAMSPVLGALLVSLSHTVVGPSPLLCHPYCVLLASLYRAVVGPSPLPCHPYCVLLASLYRAVVGPSPLLCHPYWTVSLAMSPVLCVTRLTVPCSRWTVSLVMSPVLCVTRLTVPCSRWTVSLAMSPVLDRLPCYVTRTVCYSPHCTVQSLDRLPCYVTRTGPSPLLCHPYCVLLVSLYRAVVGPSPLPCHPYWVLYSPPVPCSRWSVSLAMSPVLCVTRLLYRAVVGPSPLPCHPYCVLLASCTVQSLDSLPCHVTRTVCYSSHCTVQSLDRLPCYVTRTVCYSSHCTVQSLDRLPCHVTRTVCYSSHCTVQCLNRLPCYVTRTGCFTRLSVPCSRWSVSLAMSPVLCVTRPSVPCSRWTVSLAMSPVLGVTRLLYRAVVGPSPLLCHPYCVLLASCTVQSLDRLPCHVTRTGCYSPLCTVQSLDRLPCHVTRTVCYSSHCTVQSLDRLPCHVTRTVCYSSHCTVQSLDRLPCYVTRTGCFTRLSVPCSRWTVFLAMSPVLGALLVSLYRAVVGPSPLHVTRTGCYSSHCTVQSLDRLPCYVTHTLDRPPCHVTRTGRFTRLSVPYSRWTVSLAMSPVLGSTRFSVPCSRWTVSLAMSPVLGSTRFSVPCSRWTVSLAMSPVLCVTRLLYRAVVGPSPLPCHPYWVFYSPYCTVQSLDRLPCHVTRTVCYLPLCTVQSLDRLPCHVIRTGCFTRLSVPCSRWTVSLAMLPVLCVTRLTVPCSRWTVSLAMSPVLGALLAPLYRAVVGPSSLLCHPYWVLCTVQLLDRLPCYVTRTVCYSPHCTVQSLDRLPCYVTRTGCSVPCSRWIVSLAMSPVLGALLASLYRAVVGPSPLLCHPYVCSVPCSRWTVSLVMSPVLGALYRAVVGPSSLLCHPYWVLCTVQSLDRLPCYVTRTVCSVPCSRWTVSLAMSPVLGALLASLYRAVVGPSPLLCHPYWVLCTVQSLDRLPCYVTRTGRFTRLSVPCSRWTVSLAMSPVLGALLASLYRAVVGPSPLLCHPYCVLLASLYRSVVGPSPWLCHPYWVLCTVQSLDRLPCYVTRTVCFTRLSVPCSRWTVSLAMSPVLGALLASCTVQSLMVTLYPWRIKSPVFGASDMRRHYMYQLHILR